MAARLGASALLAVAAASEPNPPVWPSSVRVFRPADNDIEQTVNAAFSTTGGDGNNGHFVDKRFAFLFLPGDYSASVPVGYYTTVHGLGESPNDTGVLLLDSL